jgi:hypothetical protein
MSIINELNLLKVISSGNIDLYGLQERFIAFDDKGVEMIMDILQNLKSKKFITAEKDFSNSKKTGVIKLTNVGFEYLNKKTAYIHNSNSSEMMNF